MPRLGLNDTQIAEIVDCSVWTERRVATPIAVARTYRLHLTDGMSCHRPGEYFSRRIKRDDPSPAPVPSRLGTGHAFNRTQDRSLLARSATAESSTYSGAAQTSWSDTSLSTASCVTKHSPSRMADGCSRNQAGLGGGQGQFDHDCRGGESTKDRELSQPRARPIRLCQTTN